jgi:integrase
MAPQKHQKFRCGQRLCSLFSRSERLGLVWSVQAVSYTHTITIKRASNATKKAPTPTDLNQKISAQVESRLVVSREHFMILLSAPMSLRDRLIIELPTLQGFRAGEVSNFQAEYANFERGLIGVMDTKKHRLFWNPMRRIMASHLDQYMEITGIRYGTLIQPLPGAPHTGRKPGSKTLGVGLSIKHLETVWKIRCIENNLPVMSPRMGRAIFAVWWMRIKHKPIGYLKVQLRHDKIESTEKYWEKILDFDDLMDEFQDADREDDCFSKAAALGGHRDRMFQENTEEVQA